MIRQSSTHITGLERALVIQSTVLTRHDPHTERDSEDTKATLQLHKKTNSIQLEKEQLLEASEALKTEEGEKHRRGTGREPVEMSEDVSLEPRLIEEPDIVNTKRERNVGCGSWATADRRRHEGRVAASIIM
jgi:hypothetical protein